MSSETGIIRCDWANRSPLEQHYHDHEWGVPVYDDRKLFKQLILEGKQAGLSWATILSKMDTLCEAFDNFDPEVIIHYDDKKVEELLSNDGIIKNRLKVNAVIHNAHIYFKIVKQYGSLSEFIWRYVDHKPIINHWTTIKEVPASTPLSDQISKDLKKIGFKFVGTTTIYAFMQSIGMVNDHLVSCVCYQRAK